MQALKLKIAIALVLFVLFASIVPTRATDYNPGVSAGQWVKYYGIQAVGPFVISDPDNTDWMKTEVTQVSGRNVSLHMTAQYKNGTATDETSLNVDVETGWSNQSGINGNFFLIAGNLQEGDSLPGLTVGLSAMKINRTETRIYNGASRSVNIVNTTLYEPGAMDIRFVMIYDQTSGMLLWINVSMVYFFMPSANMALSFNAIDASFFTKSTDASATGWLQDNMPYVVAMVIIVIVVVAVAVVLMRKKKPSTKEPATKSSTTETQQT